MNTIKYTSIINSFVSTEGANGMMTNYVYYSILVVYVDGSSEIVEGKNRDIQYLLKYLRTPVDETIELKEALKAIRKDVNDSVDQKIAYIVNSIYPIPEIKNKNEVEALQALREAGLIPILKYNYPDSTPSTGIVRSYSRNGENFKKVNVEIIHETPKVENLKLEEALQKISEEGFTADVRRMVVSGRDDGIVLHCIRNDESKLHVQLDVSISIPETKGMPVDKACELLREKGYTTTVEKKTCSLPPNTIASWESISENKIKLFVSVPEQYESKMVSIKWSDMLESSGDSYDATASLNTITNILRIKVSYTIRTKTRHQIIGIGCSSPVDSHPHVSFKTMEPNVNDTFDITLPFEKEFDGVSSNLTFSLETQYGLMKKRENVNLQFEILW